MKLIKAISMAIALLFILLSAFAQPKPVEAKNDSCIHLPAKYIRQVETKVGKYYSRMTGKTEKTLVKLARFEGRIKTLLQKINADAAARLFDNQPSFADVLARYREGKVIAAKYGRQYDEYRDKLVGTMGYLASPRGTSGGEGGKASPQPSPGGEGEAENGAASPPAPLPGGEKGVVEIGGENGATKVMEVKDKLLRLDSLVNNTEAVQQFIKERKQQLINVAMQYIGKSKWLQKINKNSYYYFETLKNYKSIFESERKAEETALAILSKISAWQEFLQKNNALASLFSLPGGGAGQSLAGLQTRASVQTLIAQNFGSGPNLPAGQAGAMAPLRDNVQAAQAQLNQLKDKVLQAGGNSSNDELPDFKPNQQKARTLLQRIELSTNLQHQRGNSFLPVTSDIGISVGYRLNNRSVAGVGMSGKIGWGRNIQNIRITGEGIGFRSYINWRLKSKGSFWLSGGAELNYQARFYSTTILNNFSNWQQSALIGVMKKYSVGKKLKGSVSILYDALYNQQVPARQPVVFRVGYSLN